MKGSGWFGVSIYEFARVHNTLIIGQALWLGEWCTCGRICVCCVYHECTNRSSDYIRLACSLPLFVRIFNWKSIWRLTFPLNPFTRIRFYTRTLSRSVILYKRFTHTHTPRFPNGKYTNGLACPRDDHAWSLNKQDTGAPRARQQSLVGRIAATVTFRHRDRAQLDAVASALIVRRCIIIFFITVSRVTRFIQTRFRHRQPVQSIFGFIFNYIRLGYFNTMFEKISYTRISRE